MRGTHGLLSTDRGTSQSTKRKRECEGYSLSVEHRRRDKSGYQEKVRKRKGEGDALPVERRHFKTPGESESTREKLTNCRTQTVGQVRTPRETEGARDTHFLSDAGEEGMSVHQKTASEARYTDSLSGTEGVTSKDIERK